jgi:hypothetical protein
VFGRRAPRVPHTRGRTIAAAQWPRQQRAGPARGSSRGAEASVIFGAMLTVLGALNQVARHPPLVVDLTLQRGNGGFVVPG